MNLVIVVGQLRANRLAIDEKENTDPMVALRLRKYLGTHIGTDDDLPVYASRCHPSPVDSTHRGVLLSLLDAGAPATHFTTTATAVINSGVTTWLNPTDAQGDFNGTEASITSTGVASYDADLKCTFSISALALAGQRTVEILIRHRWDLDVGPSSSASLVVTVRKSDGTILATPINRSTGSQASLLTETLDISSATASLTHTEIQGIQVWCQADCTIDVADIGSDASWQVDGVHVRLNYLRPVYAIGECITPAVRRYVASKIGTEDDDLDVYAIDCCIATPECPDICAEAVPASYNATFAGFTGSSCADCSFYNATHSIFYQTGCLWKRIYTPHVPCTDWTTEIRLFLTSLAPTKVICQVIMTNLVLPGNHTYAWSALRSAWNCFGSNTMTRDTSFDSGSVGACATPPTTITVAA